MVRSEQLKQHQGLVHKIAHRYRWALGACLDFEDLLQAGNMGLIRGLEKFDPARGVKESSYCVWWIRSYISAEVENHHRTIRIPANTLQKLRRAKTPLPCPTSSLDAEDGELSETLSASDDSEPRVPDAPSLTYAERLTVRKHLQGYSYPEIAQEEGVTSQAVSLRMMRATAKLRAYVGAAL